MDQIPDKFYNLDKDFEPALMKALKHLGIVILIIVVFSIVFLSKTYGAIGTMKHYWEIFFLKKFDIGFFFINLSVIMNYRYLVEYFAVAEDAGSLYIYLSGCLAALSAACFSIMSGTEHLSDPVFANNLKNIINSIFILYFIVGNSYFLRKRNQFRRAFRERTGG